MQNIVDNIFIHPGKKTQFPNFKSIAKEFKVIDGILPNLIWPMELPVEDQHSKNFYEGRAKQYEDSLHLTFFTHSADEVKVRNSFIDKLNINSNSKVLEIACGTGRDSILISKRLGKGGELHMQDISEDMIKICIEKLSRIEVKKSFCLSNAHYLPYPDNYFDATYSFGALGEFSDKKKVFKEMVRVTKPGGKIVVGDESIPIWLRKTKYYNILVKTNPMFEATVPLEDIPIEARNTNLCWVLGSTFYLLDFEVGVGEPTADFDFEIPGVRGGTYRTRYEGQLEGVKPETKEKAWEFVKAKGLNMHTWLDQIINDRLKDDL